MQILRAAEAVAGYDAVRPCRRRTAGGTADIARRRRRRCRRARRAARRRASRMRRVTIARRRAICWSRWAARNRRRLDRTAFRSAPVRSWHGRWIRPATWCATAHASTRCCWCGWIRRCSTRRPQQRAADGVVAYSAICPHTGCEVVNWSADRQILECPCHNSQYDPKAGARVIGGPSPRGLAALPLRVADGKLTVARPFIGRLGIQQI